MVQLTEGAWGQAEAAPPSDYQPFSLEQISHTQINGQFTQELGPSHHFPSPHLPVQQFFTDTSAAVTHSSHEHCVTPLSDISQPTDLGLVSAGHSSFQSQLFTAFGSVDRIPTTRLDSSIVMPDKASEFTDDVSTDMSRSFEIVPVIESQGVNEVNNMQQKDFCIMDNTQATGGDTLDNMGSKESHTVDNKQARDCYAVDNALQQDTRVDSIDSLNDSKGYTSDSSSDVYMNSDYTDTVTSADSTAFLLQTASHCTNNTGIDEEPLTQVPSSADEPSPVTDTTYYSNEAFSDSSKELITWSSNESGLDSKLEVAQDTGKEKADEADNWVISVVEEEDSGMMADKEDDEEDLEDTEKVPLQADSEVETLVHQLVDQHPDEMVDITIQVLDGPVYESLTEPMQEETWLQSTESLHLYKLLKQGRSSTMNNLRVHAINNLRANTMNNLHERSSFLNLTAASVTSLGRACQKALSYVRADMEFGSMISLRDNAKLSPTSGDGEPPSDTVALSSEFSKKKGPSVASGRHTRNVLYISLLVTILLIAVNATRNLQSSLNQEGGVGIICLAVLFAAYTMGSLLSPVLVQTFGVRACIVGGLVLQLLYVAANLYPVMWLMLPASLGGGLSLAVIWNANSTYIVLLARGESVSKQISYERVSDKYFGYFCLIYQSNLIIGNLIASLVLTFGSGIESNAAILPFNGTGLNSTATNFSAMYTEDLAPNKLSTLEDAATDFLGMGAEENIINSSSAVFDATKDSHYHLCGSEYCHHFVISQESSAVPVRTIYLLFGIFISLVGLTLVMAICLLEPLSPHIFSSPSSGTARPWLNVKRQIVSLLKFCHNVKFLLLLPLLLYSCMQFSFVCSEVMMAYVTCPVGVWLVGYTMMAYGVCCSLASYATQALVPRTGRSFFIGIATALNIGLLVFMRLWQPHPDSVLPVFVITSLFGIADGIWNVNANGVCGSVFPDHFEEAFTGLRVAQGLGGAFSMGYAPFFCMSVKIYIMIVAVIIVFLGCIGAEILLKRDVRKNAIHYEKEIV